MEFWGFENRMSWTGEDAGLFRAEPPAATGPAWVNPATAPQQPQVPEAVVKALSERFSEKEVQRLLADPSLTRALMMGVEALSSQDQKMMDWLNDANMDPHAWTLEGAIEYLLARKGNTELRQVMEGPKGDRDVYIPGLAGQQQAKFRNDFLRKLVFTHAQLFQKMMIVTDPRDGEEKPVPGTQIWEDLIAAYKLAEEADGMGPTGRKDGWITEDELEEMPKPDQEAILRLAVFTQKALKLYREINGEAPDKPGGSYTVKGNPELMRGVVTITEGGKGVDLVNGQYVGGDKKLLWNYRVDQFIKGWHEEWRETNERLLKMGVVDYQPAGKGAPVKMSGIMAYRYALRDLRDFLLKQIDGLDRNEGQWLQVVALDRVDPKDAGLYLEALKGALIRYRDFVNRQMEAHRVVVNIRRFETNGTTPSTEQAKVAARAAPARGSRGNGEPTGSGGNQGSTYVPLHLKGKK